MHISIYSHHRQWCVFEDVKSPEHEITHSFRISLLHCFRLKAVVKNLYSKPIQREYRYVGVDYFYISAFFIFFTYKILAGKP